jgi:hypothetical protein
MRLNMMARWDAAASRVINDCPECSWFARMHIGHGGCKWRADHAPDTGVHSKCPLPEATKMADWHEQAGRVELAARIRAGIKEAVDGMRD